uniref:PS II complex 12 kDa extrinsic protein n=1 Tax=Trieres chinensis TaxID=1514140 RepID=A0A7S1ZHI0_TRICV|mmetsp:Transcript_25705/g.52646  ORF Transcript_25705/g.52646 Transcript_25705/m.52646 type:complete len:221 (+) Transcript_25705:62-724(+)|eukprot:CAMPEP_0183301832 /NCGR_PEP_ID=MMETSP0160_2-20130417/7827_1 /TAXON_ID=2839 ORGANISM="Odontella Sinensis, Strain Grunow 1884" /NCGR_SAMPLE_ID=MMETSP0160_2 /ASSEMBLY_ACC=CAM_ASM_000250 /LENGTH=220 /DNA_ID=CAMNT_0025464521 /DNA_START=62 /DNA_END=724 /DNA_ORIENTATION=-
MKMPIAALLFGSAAAFAPNVRRGAPTVTFMEKGAGGMFDTRNPKSFVHDDPRKSISAAPSFEEYMKMRSGAEKPAATIAPTAPAAPVAKAAPIEGTGRGSYLDSIQGVGRVSSGGGVPSTYLSNIQGPGRNEGGGATGASSYLTALSGAAATSYAAPTAPASSDMPYVPQSAPAAPVAPAYSAPAAPVSEAYGRGSYLDSIQGPGRETYSSDLSSYLSTI